MKVKPILIIGVITMLHVTKVLAQTPQHIIKVDFADLQKEYKTTVNYGETFTVEVSHINRNLFKIDGVKTETDYNITIPGALAGVKLPGFLNITVPKTSVSALPSSKRDLSSTGLLEEIVKEQQKITTYGQVLSDAALFGNDLVHLSKDCVPDYSKWLKTVVKRTDRFINGGDGDDSADPKVLSTDLATLLNGLASNAQQSYSRMNDYVAQYTTKANRELDSNYNAKLKQLAEIQIELKKRGLSEEDKQEDLKNQEIFKDFIKAYPENQKKITVASSALKENLDKAKATVDEILKQVKDDKLYPVVKLYNQLISPNTFTYTSEVMTAKTDEITFTITAEPSELNTCSVNAKKIIVATIRTHGGLKIDFSTGAFMNWGSEKFLGNTYYYHNIDANSREIITAERGSRKLLSIGALMHFYKRSEKTFKLAGSLGVSTTANLTDLNFHVGPSLIIGDKDRIVISAGMTLKSAPVLDQQLQTNKSYTKLESPDAIPTVSVFPIRGWFLGVSYNISKFTSGK